MSRRAAKYFWRLAIALGLLAAVRCPAANYYFHPLAGSDTNAGTNRAAPFQSLSRLRQLKLAPGDAILLAAGQKFSGQIALENVHGTAVIPVLVSSYGPSAAAGDERPQIDARGFVAGVCLKNCSGIELENLQITANGGGMAPGQIVKPDLRCGVLVTADRPGEFSGFTFSNLLVKDVFYEAPGFRRGLDEIQTANGTQKYGWGIEFLNREKAAVLQNIFIAHCEITNVSHTGLEFAAASNGLREVTVRDLRVRASGGPGVQMSGLSHGRFTQLDVNGSGSTNDTRNWKRGSGLWTWSCDDVVIEQSRFQNANGPGDSCGVHIDYHCRNVIVQKNFSAHNAGGFCEILGDNYNCAYRYNVSVNDGCRTKGVNGAFQEGKTFWLSGYVGDQRKQEGPFNTYFYNNTIFVGKNLTAKFSISPTAHGVLIANNIFCIEGQSKIVKGDQTRRDANQIRRIGRVVFENNLFLRPENWPSSLQLRDQRPIIGNPEFQNTGGLNLADYRPANKKLVRGRGMVVPKIPGDTIGLAGGLQVERDILDQPVSVFPSLGAIEIAPSQK